MNLAVLGTGSSGNCVILTSEKTGHSIMLDCGLKFKDITHSQLFCGFEKLDCVVCSHIH